MPKLFKDKGTEDIYNGNASRQARNTCPEKLWSKAQRRMDALVRSSSLEELGKFPGFDLKKMKGDRDGQWRIILGGRYRISFIWLDKETKCIEITNHYGD